MISALAQLPIAVNLTVFVLAASGVWFAGSRLAIYADAIADRKRIGQAFMGLVFVAAATSLPEMVTTLYGALAGEAELVLGNMFGGITMQTAILALADLSFAAVALTSYPRGPPRARSDPAHSPPGLAHRTSRGGRVLAALRRRARHAVSRHRLCGHRLHAAGI
ncbi:hypothetical protein [Methyloceanibacter superfactus]|uniref:hypothetical protein n=1 Tax=Methyloceanibacter superfactus TaxID=1774969 RepID=UPI0013011AD6|nr:hypothetical protein [Methyloceanibacter superfactus]